MITSREVLSAGLVCSVLALSIVVWQQRLELQRLQTGLGWNESAAGSFQVGEEIVEPTGAERWRGPLLPLPSVAVRTRVSAGSPSPPDRRQGAGVVAMMEDPRFLKAMASHQRSLLDARFGELFGKLSLTAEELDVLRTLLIEKQNAGMDVLMVSRGELGDQMDGNELRAATTRAHQDIDRMIQQTLGEQRYAVFKAYEATMPQRAAVNQLAQRLSYSDEPLQPAQAEALVELMVASGGAVRPAQPGVSMVIDPEERQAVPIVHGMVESVEITEQVLERAVAVLQPKQLDALLDLRREQEAASMVVELARDRLAIPSSFTTLNPLEGWEVQILIQ